MRYFLSLCAGLLFLTHAQAAELGDDGLHKQPWFTDSFLELAEDLADAASEGKDLLILFEQKGCPYCRELHEVNFERPQIVTYLTDHFVVLQLDLRGAREVLDFDGETLDERALAMKWGVNFTPSSIIFPADAVDLSSAKAAEAFRMPGYFKPFHFLTVLEFVATDAYRDQAFQSYFQEAVEQAKSQGLDPESW